MSGECCTPEAQIQAGSQLLEYTRVDLASGMLAHIVPYLQLVHIRTPQTLPEVFVR
jgi:hypothetical protein